MLIAVINNVLVSLKIGSLYALNITLTSAINYPAFKGKKILPLSWNVSITVNGGPVLCYYAWLLLAWKYSKRATCVPWLEKSASTVAWIELKELYGPAHHIIQRPNICKGKKERKTMEMWQLQRLIKMKISFCLQKYCSSSIMSKF